MEKSKFIAREVQFLGFNLDDQGISPSSEKVEAIQKFPKPKNRKQLQSFLGLCNSVSYTHLQWIANINLAKTFGQDEGS